MPAQDAARPTTQSLTVSLEDHLARALRSALPLLPNSVASDLREVLDAPLPQVVRGDTDTNGLGPGDATPPSPVRTIPYALLSAISRWARTREGAAALARREPPLSPHDYAMVSLLAGTRICPDRKYPSVSVPGTSDDAQAAQRRELDDRRAITAVVNALLTVAGSGLAVYWAAGRLAWKEEWKVLLALFVAITVAASEGILYLIWSSRRQNPKLARTASRFREGQSSARRAPAMDEKADTIPSSSPESDAVPFDPSVITATSIRPSGTDQGTLRERLRPDTGASVAGRRNQ